MTTPPQPPRTPSPPAYTPLPSSLGDVEDQTRADAGGQPGTSQVTEYVSPSRIGAASAASSTPPDSPTRRLLIIGRSANVTPPGIDRRGTSSGSSSPVRPRALFPNPDQNQRPLSAQPQLIFPTLPSSSRNSNTRTEQTAEDRLQPQGFLPNRDQASSSQTAFSTRQPHSDSLIFPDPAAIRAVQGEELPLQVPVPGPNDTPQQPPPSTIPARQSLSDSLILPDPIHQPLQMPVPIDRGDTYEALPAYTQRDHRNDAHIQLHTPQGGPAHEEDDDPADYPLLRRTQSMEIVENLSLTGLVISVAGIVLSGLRRAPQQSVGFGALAALSFAGYVAMQQLRQDIEEEPAQRRQPSDTFLRLFTSVHTMQTHINRMSVRILDLEQTRNTLEQQIIDLQGAQENVYALVPGAQQGLPLQEIVQGLTAARERLGTLQARLATLYGQIPQDRVFQDFYQSMRQTYDLEILDPAQENLSSSQEGRELQLIVINLEELSESDRAFLQQVELLGFLQERSAMVTELVREVSTGQDDLHLQILELQRQIQQLRGGTSEASSSN